MQNEVAQLCCTRHGAMRHERSDASLVFATANFPLYLAPMAGVSDKIFRQLCKEHGADVLVTEFVSAEGVFRRNERTRDYLDFDEMRTAARRAAFRRRRRAHGGSGAAGGRLGAARFHRPEFRLPGEQSRREKRRLRPAQGLPDVRQGRRAVVRAVAPLPVTAKIRIGWDEQTRSTPSTVAQHPGGVRHRRARGPWPDARAGLLRRGGLGCDRAKSRRRCASR